LRRSPKYDNRSDITELLGLVDAIPLCAIARLPDQLVELLALVTRTRRRVKSIVCPLAA
jgi:hypothetical protein